LRELLAGDDDLHARFQIAQDLVPEIAAGEKRRQVAFGFGEPGVDPFVEEVRRVPPEGSKVAIGRQRQQSPRRGEQRRSGAGGIGAEIELARFGDRFGVAGKRGGERKPGR
jgi:hypothetical protein